MDEVDRMLDMGFIADVIRIVSLLALKQRQTADPCCQRHHQRRHRRAGRIDHANPEESPSTRRNQA
jgi:superfamily II DNA/RNA helicase